MCLVDTIPVRLWPGRLIFSFGHERAPTNPTMRRPVLSYGDLNPHMCWGQVGTGINANITEVLRRSRARLGHRH